MGNKPRQAASDRLVIHFAIRKIHLYAAATAIVFFLAGFFTHALISSPPEAEISSPTTASVSDRNTEPGQALAQVNRVAVSADDDPVLGPPDAPVTIVEFSDFQCPFCKRFKDNTLDRILSTYRGKVRYVYRDFPLNIHPYAQKAAEAAECADEQGRFWEFHDLLFERQPALAVASLKRYAAQLGLDTVAFNHCLDSGRYASEVHEDYADGIQYGVTGTPGFFINGQKLIGAKPFSIFQQIIDAELAGTGS